MLYDPLCFKEPQEPSVVPNEVLVQAIEKLIPKIDNIGAQLRENCHGGYHFQACGNECKAKMQSMEKEILPAR